MIVSILIMNNRKRSKVAEEVNGLQNLIKKLMHLYSGYNLIFLGCVSDIQLFSIQNIFFISMSYILQEFHFVIGLSAKADFYFLPGMRLR